MPRRPRASPPPRVFLLSPARLDGARARMLFHPVTMFPVARALRSVQGAPIGDVFSFLSGLYFRGKLAYARAFAAPPDRDSAISGAGVFVITPAAGLRSPDTPVTLAALRAFAGIDVSPANPKYRRPLERSAKAIAADVGGACDVV